MPAVGRPYVRRTTKKPALLRNACLACYARVVKSTWGGGGGALHCLLSPCSLVAPNMVRVIITVIIDPRTVCEVS